MILLHKENIILLTKFIDETYHDYKLSDGDCLSTCSCGNKGMDVWDFCINQNRNFDRDNDMLTVYRKIIDKGYFNEFYDFLIEKWCTNPRFILKYLFQNPKEFCYITSNFFKEKMKKDEI